MDIVFSCLQNGRKLYAVREYGEDLFVGTRGQCDRFRSLHLQKVLREREASRHPPRHEAVVVRTYRTPRKLHA